ncbi:MAG: tyrosine-type recombinase/integrase [Gammaproteobacteria bacterium]|nr:tyrosine-type recombinase/integrase [Gammaproteobacteria bacterium]MYE49765.1 tyrosine-type recombinase/integrase [Gammaproteobacteria bacterium]
MTLREAIEQFIAFRISLGSRFVSQSYELRHFLKKVDGEMACDDVTVEQVCSYLTGEGPLTQTRAFKYTVLNTFWRYAISRGYASRSPLPDNEPRKPRSPLPYVYRQDELQRLFQAIEVNQKRARSIDANTLRMLLLLLYGAGLRGGEARRLRMSDVDLPEALLTVRLSKFYKTRLVPVGPQLADALRNYAKDRASRAFPHGEESAFLANRDGKALNRYVVQTTFARLRKTAGIVHADKTVLSPTLHSLRHTFAVNRVTAWYREGADVQRLLPALSTYLGHSRLSDTQVYLSMTPELLQEASLRFENFVSANTGE